MPTLPKKNQQNGQGRDTLPNSAKWVSANCPIFDHGCVSSGSGTFRHQPFGRQYGVGHMGNKSVDQMGCQIDQLTFFSFLTVVAMNFDFTYQKNSPLLCNKALETAFPSNHFSKTGRMAEVTALSVPAN